MRPATLSLIGFFLGFAFACASGDPEPTDASAHLAPVAAPPSDGLPPQGSWSYEESCGENAGGTPVVVGYSLRITDQEVVLDADGYQTMLRTVGTATVDAAGVWSVRFVRLGEEALGDTYLKPGDVMLTFTVEEGELQITPGELIFNCTQTTRFSRAG